MESTTLICKRCKAPLEYEEGSSVARCPNCGYTELIDETEALRAERIRAKAYKDTELGKSKIEKDANIAEKSLQIEEKRLGITRIKIILVAALVAAIAVFGIWKTVKNRHKDEIMIPMDSVSYCQRNYQETRALLEDAGFTDIEYSVQETLSMNERELEGVVTQVSINGSTIFDKGKWFPNDSVVKITYCTMDPSKANDLIMPVSAVDCIGKRYQSIVDKLKEAGFDNIKLVPYADLNMDHKSDDEKITKISLNNDEEFHQGDYYSADTAIYVSYHTMDPERLTDVQIPDKYEKYIGMDYLEACKELQMAGFENITLIPKYDLKLYEGSEHGVIQAIAIDGDNAFLKGKWMPHETEVRITFRAKEQKHIGKKFEEVKAELESVGFTEIVLEPLNDLEPNEAKKAGVIESLLIGEQEFDEAEELNLIAPVRIIYHSERQATASQVKLSASSKALLGKNFEEVEDTLSKMGFTDVSTVPLEDLTKDWLKNDGTVKEISINETTKFSEGEIFDKDAKVIISYHSFKPEEPVEEIEVSDDQVLITTASKKLVGDDYQNVVNILTEMGFTNIKTKALGDLKKGWLHKEGEVEEVSIGEETKFAENDVFDKNVEVIVSYHSYPE